MAPVSLVGVLEAQNVQMSLSISITSVIVVRAPRNIYPFRIEISI